MPSYDARCNVCQAEFEYLGKYENAPGNCPKCESPDTRVIWKTVPVLDKAKDPYDLLTGKGSSGGAGKKIISGPKYSSKTTV